MTGHAPGHTMQQCAWMDAVRRQFGLVLACVVRNSLAHCGGLGGIDGTVIALPGVLRCAQNSMVKLSDHFRGAESTMLTRQHKTRLAAMHGEALRFTCATHARAACVARAPKRRLRCAMDACTQIEHPSIHVAIHPSIHPSAYLPTYLSMYQTIHLSIIWPPDSPRGP